MGFKIVNSVDDILRNLETLESYYESENLEERKFYRFLFSKGKTFLLVEKNGTKIFGPSKFIGYQNNTMDLYNTYKGHPVKTMTGIQTNHVISELLNKKEQTNFELEIELKDFYVSKRLKYNAYKKKFWKLNIK